MFQLILRPILGATATLLWWLLRWTFSSLLLAVGLYRLGAVDELLRHLFTAFFSVKFRLRVQSRSLRTQMRDGFCVVRVADCRLLAPPLEEDPRWRFEHMGKMRLLVIKLRPVTFLVKLVLSSGSLFSLEHIVMIGVEGFVEGYYDMPTTSADQPLPADLRGEHDYDRLQLNITLIGGEFEPGKQRYPPSVEQGSYASTRWKVHQADSRQGKSRSGSSVYRQLILMLTEAGKLLEHRLDRAFRFAVRRIHERLRGGEPVAQPGEMAIQTREVIVRDIRVHVSNIAPLPLAWVESSPIEVGLIRIGPQGYRSSLTEPDLTWQEVPGSRYHLADWLESFSDQLVRWCDDTGSSEDELVADGMQGVPMNLVQHFMERELLAELVLRLFGMHRRRSESLLQSLELTVEESELLKEWPPEQRRSFHPLLTLFDER